MIRIVRFDAIPMSALAHATQQPDAVVVSAVSLREWVEGVMEGDPGHAEELLEDMRGALLRLAPPPHASAYVRLGRPCALPAVAEEGSLACEACGWDVSWHDEAAQERSREAAKADRLADALEELDLGTGDEDDDQDKPEATGGEAST